MKTKFNWSCVVVTSTGRKKRISAKGTIAWFYTSWSVSICKKDSVQNWFRAWFWRSNFFICKILYCTTYQGEQEIANDFFSRKISYSFNNSSTHNIFTFCNQIQKSNIYWYRLILQIYNYTHIEYFPFFVSFFLCFLSFFFYQ